MEDVVPPTQPDGALVPPPPTPPVATGSYVPMAPEPHRRPDAVLEEAAALVGSVARRALDFLDELGDAIAETVGLRAKL
jgi:hypothetical protein